MSHKFLETIADYILALSIAEIENLKIILPNRRSEVFLRKYIAHKTTKTIWLPSIYAIEDFVYEASNFQKTVSTDLIFELYESYLQMDDSQDKSFEDFGNFGPQLLKDFNDIDSFLVDAQVVFTFLKEARALQIWEPDVPNSGDLEKKYLTFYARLYDYYKNFKAKLSQKNLAYYGMALRSLVESSKNETYNSHNFIIAGFNAISKAEEKLFEMLSANQKAIIFVDADEHYSKDYRQEAGRYLKTFFKNEKLKVKLIESNGFKTPKEINIIGLTGEYGMTKYAAQIIHNWIQSPDFEPEETAIILPNEELLFPLLGALPDNLKAMNITMSYPFRRTAGYDLVIRLFEIYESAMRFLSRTEGKSTMMHHKAISNLFGNNLIKRYFDDYCQQFLKIVKNENFNLIGQDVIIKISDEMGYSEKEHPFKYLNINNLEGESILNSIMNTLQMVENCFSDNDFEKSIFQENRKIISRLHQKFVEYKIDEQPSVLKKIFQSMANFNGISFEGKPLAGLQIMGLLETRTLDFKQVIYLSFNEGNLPASSQFHSFILPEIRYKFGMPMPIDEDAITAYHFYRSIQRAEKVVLIYNTLAGMLGGGEMSRYGKQLLNEVKNDQVKITNTIIELPQPKDFKAKEIVVAKNEKVMEELLSIACSETAGFSPSSLSVYLNCPLQFYFKRVLRIKPIDEVEEVIAENTRGLAIHEIFERMYSAEALAANKFDKDFFENALKTFKPILNEAYANIFKKGDIKHGYNLIIRALDETVIERFLQKDKSFSLGISNVECEINLNTYIPITIDGKVLNIRISGNADRIDYHNGVHRIIDYKTGATEENELKINPVGENLSIWEDIFLKKKKQKTFQLMVYSYLYFRNNPNVKQLLPIIAALKTNQIFFTLKPEKGLINTEIVEEFSQQLIHLIEQILDKNLPFSQTTVKEVCKNCDFKKVCNR